MSDNKFKEIDQYLKDLDSGEIDPQVLYNHKMVNWRGPTSPDPQKNFFTDYIAKNLLGRLDIFDLDIKSQRADYFVPDHDGVTKKQTKRTEEIFAKSLLGHSIEHLGKVIGYQMPLKATLEDNFGKVDLVSFKENEPTAYLIELKMANKKETLLRAALEIHTYQQVVEKDVLADYIMKKKERFGISVPDELKAKDFSVNKAVLFALNDSVLPKELKSKYTDTYKNLWDLITKLEIGVYTIPHTYPVTKHEYPNT